MGYTITTGSALIKQKGLASTTYSLGGVSGFDYFGLATSDSSLENAGACKIYLYDKDDNRTMTASVDMNGSYTTTEACLALIGDKAELAGSFGDLSGISAGANTIVDAGEKQHKVFAIDSTNQASYTSGKLVVKVTGRNYSAIGEVNDNATDWDVPENRGLASGSGLIEIEVPFTGAWS